MAAGLALQLAFSNYVLTVCKTLRSCKQCGELQRIVQELLHLAALARQDSSDLGNTAPAKEAGPVPESLKMLYHELLSSRDVSVLVTLAFCQHLEVIVCSMLPGRDFLAWLC